MPGSWETCDLECHGERHGLGFAARTGQSLFGDRRRWFALHGGMQLAVDTTLVSPLLCGGAAEIDGAALTVARRRKARTELAQRMGSVGGERPLVR